MSRFLQHASPATLLTKVQSVTLSQASRVLPVVYSSQFITLLTFITIPAPHGNLFIQRSKATRVIKNENFYSAHVHVFWGSRLTLYVSSPIIGDIRCETLHFKAKNKRGFLKL